MHPQEGASAPGTPVRGKDLKIQGELVRATRNPL